LFLIKKKALVVIIVGIINFIWFAFESSLLGGDALNGFVKDGRYYLSNHGIYTEVTKTIWYYSKLHAESLFITHPLAILGLAYLGISRKL
jgi:hypothetical protein